MSRLDLKQDYDEFEFSRENQCGEANVEENLQNLNNKSSDSEKEDLLRCEICDQKFQNKKDLQTHVLIHLGKPRVVLKRIVDVKTIVKKESTDQYWLDKEQKGNLKITLKRQSPVGDSLKLRFKKSPASEDFTVVSGNCNLIEKSTVKQNALADIQENDKSDSEEEETTEQSFENVMLNQESNYDDDNDNFESEPDHNPLENSERPLMDNAEGDSGVGSDSVQAPEKEEQNEDDNADSNSNSDQVELADNEDPEESDALEATCRETIENLKKLGEQSSSRSSDLLNPTETPVTEEEEEDEEEEEKNDEKEKRPSCVIEELRGNSEISIVPKSALMPEPSTSSPREADTEIVPIGGSSSSSFSWNKISDDSNSSKSKDDETTEKDTPDNTEAAGSLLQNFLIEHQRNQNETNLSSSAHSFETEYVSLERLAETVNTCRICNEKFKDIAHLDAHRSKAGHYQCNIPDCSALVFTNPEAVAVHKAQAHGAPISPSLSSVSPHLSSSSPHAANSPRLNQTSPHLNAHSPHSPSVHPARNSPMTSPHANSPTFGTTPATSFPPVNLEQLPAPVQQLAQQVQRMPLPQPQIQQMPAGANNMIPGASYYPQPPGRPPMYRVQAPMHYPPQLPHLYQQYGGNPYQLGMQGLQPQIPQQVTRGRYPGVVPQRGRMPQPPISAAPMPRTRMKRPMASQPTQQMQQMQQQLQQQQLQQQQSVSAPKQRRMDVLLPDRNEDADCHVIAQQKRNDGLPVIQNVQGGANVQSSSSRNDSTIHLTDSITLSVRQPAQVNAMVQGGKKSDASAVANVLASRGITVTPAANKKAQEQATQQQQQHQTQQQQKQPLNMPALNLNSAISIIPAASAQRKQQDQQGQFAVPQNKQSKQVTNEVERPPRPPTVDLTQDTVPTPVPPPAVKRGRPTNANRMHASLTCQVCDKRFQSQEFLAQHMVSHRQLNKLIHKCNLCPAQYPTPLALQTHKRTYHKEVDTSPQQNGNVELALPVVDLRSPNTLSRLSTLGIQSYIPLSQLSAQTNGCYGLPIISIDGARNPAVCNLASIGATSILSIGPLRHLSNR